MPFCWLVLAAKCVRTLRWQVGAGLRGGEGRGGCISPCISYWGPSPPVTSTPCAYPSPHTLSPKTFPPHPHPFHQVGGDARGPARVEVAVRLPGVEGAGEAEVDVGARTVAVAVRGRYRLQVRVGTWGCGGVGMWGFGWMCGQSVSPGGASLISHPPRDGPRLHMTWQVVCRGGSRGWGVGRYVGAFMWG